MLKLSRNLDFIEPSDVQKKKKKINYNLEEKQNKESSSLTLKEKFEKISSIFGNPFQHWTNFSVDNFLKEKEEEACPIIEESN